mmetsp:Transcript_19242/g.19551  ORF Transcript_19242/g.19551 Transcript_19242/m.19551 type:complete len:108 (-) Transcript_19242:695-1018(-)
MKKEESDVIEEFQFEVDTKNTREKQRDKTLPDSHSRPDPSHSIFIRSQFPTVCIERQRRGWVKFYKVVSNRIESISFFKLSGVEVFIAFFEVDQTILTTFRTAPTFD